MRVLTCSSGDNLKVIATETRKRTRLTPEARRQQLVEIGAKLFAERPFNDVWVEEIAEAAGVSRGLVYHYFPNKQAFFSAIVGHGLRDAFETSTPDPDAPPHRWLLDGIDNLFGYAAENANIFRTIYLSKHMLGDEVTAAIRAGRELQLVRICEFVTPGDPPTETMRTAMDAWAAMLDDLLLAWLDGRETDRERLVRIAAGSLAGTVVTSLVVDGRMDRLESIGHMAPAIFGN